MCWRPFSFHDTPCCAPCSSLFDSALDPNHAQHPILGAAPHVWTTEAHLVPVGRYWHGRRLPVGNVPGEPIPVAVAPTPARQPRNGKAGVGAGGESAGGEDHRGGWRLWRGLETLGAQLLSWGRSRLGWKNRWSHEPLAQHCVGNLCVCLLHKDQPVCMVEPWWATSGFNPAVALVAPPQLAHHLQPPPDVRVDHSKQSDASQKEVQAQVLQLNGLGTFHVSHSVDHVMVQRQDTGVVRFVARCCPVAVIPLPCLCSIASFAAA